MMKKFLVLSSEFLGLLGSKNYSDYPTKNFSPEASR